MCFEYYVDLYCCYFIYCCDYDGNYLFKIVSGVSDYDYNWIEVLMKNVGYCMVGVFLYYYIVMGWSGSKGLVIQFIDDDYYWIMGKCLEIELVLKKYMVIMDKYDLKK